MLKSTIFFFLTTTPNDISERVRPVEKVDQVVWSLASIMSLSILRKLYLI